MVNGEVLPEVIDKLQDQWVSAAIRQKELDEAREVWPVHVNAALKALADRVIEQGARIAALEARLG